MNNLNENIDSKFRYSGATRFTKNPRKAMEDKLYLNLSNPGPGAYTPFSDFGVYEPNQSVILQPNQLPKLH